MVKLLSVPEDRAEVGLLAQKGSAERGFAGCIPG